MYSWLFNGIYNFLNKKTKDIDPKFSASGIVFISQIAHFALIIMIIQHFADIELPRFSKESFYNKLGLFPIGIIWLILIHVFFKKNFDKIQSKYGKKAFNRLQFLGLILISVLIPIYIAIKISGGQIWK